MSDNAKIEWTDATWNPITGCTLVSEGCRHCYAARLAATRLKNEPSRRGLARLNAAGEAKFTGEVRFNEQWLEQPLRWRKPRMIFVCAHGDLFHENVPDEWIDRVFAVMAFCPHHTFQVLTKRPERARDYASDPAAPGPRVHLGRWPLPNVWIGTSIEDQATADERIPHLLATPAAVRFVSAEPLLGPVDLTEWLHDSDCDGQPLEDAYDMCLCRFNAAGGFPSEDRIDWVIVGGESGPGARPMHPDWARALRDQCAAAGVPFFFKQWGAWGPAPDDHDDTFEAHRARGATDLLVWPDFSASELVGKSRAGRLLDGREHNAMPSTGRAA